MRKHLVVLALATAMVGCTSDWDPGARSVTVSPSHIDPVGIAAAEQGRATGLVPFATLPDRGELLAYDPARAPKQSGAYTSHPIQLSEAHALQASHEGGELVVRAPNGEALKFRYDRHEELPDGNWTWIGRSADGADAVLTFGQDAVFGVIPAGDQGTLRVTTRGRGAWLVSADRGREPDANRATTRDGAPDFLIPPSPAASVANAGQQSVPAAAAADVTPAALGQTPVDVVLGFTSTYAAEFGGPSVAQTRLNSLIAVANQALANSGVIRRFRVVRFVQVAYAEGTNNLTALEELTGYSSETNTTIPVPASLQPLRAARDQYGGDVVALVRSFRTPENDGCGIAWLIGGGQTQFTTADAPFGYSVVSDGDDVDEGDENTYLCREESLAHEIGHNLGQAHNEDDSTDTGVHPYSYGYRESSASGFYTVMAYRLADSSQFSIRHFANPAIRYQGRATGVSGSSDNVLSMNQTMPTAASFRATVLPVESAGDRGVGYVFDFDRDGKFDILWRNSTSGINAIWKSGNSAIRQPITAVPSADWKIVGTGDFEGDNRSDILWRNTRTGENTIWRAGNSAATLPVARVTSQAWQVRAVGDFDGDGKSDIVWRHDSTGENSIWRSGNVATQLPMTDVTNTYWKIVGAGDFNGDNRSDIVWRLISTGQNVIWLSGNSATQQPVTTVVSQARQIVAIADFDGDGRDDLLWRNEGNGVNQIWRSGNLATLQSMSDALFPWSIVGSADFNGDGRSDVLWRNSASGVNAIWLSANVATQQAITAVADQSWKVVP